MFMKDAEFFFFLSVSGTLNLRSLHQKFRV